MQLEFYISELLYRYECVTVPGFGAFLTNHKPAQVHSYTNAFYPPTKLIAFNKNISTNDGLLAKYLSDAEKLSYEIALIKIENAVFEWMHTLNNNEVLTLKNIGEFWLGEEETLQFSPSQHINYLTTSYGLSSFVSAPVIREQLKKEVIALEEKAPIAITAEKRRQPAYLKYAAIFVIGAAATGVFGYKYVQGVESQQLVVEQKAQEKVTQQIQEATFFDSTPLTLPAVEIQVEKIAESYKYHLIAGAFRTKENAETKVQELKAKGFDAAFILGENRYGLWQVSLQGFATANEATNTLNKIKNSEEGIWLFVAE